MRSHDRTGLQRLWGGTVLTLAKIWLFARLGPTKPDKLSDTLRQRGSRLVRETLSFSKKLTNHIGAIKYVICHYNLTRREALPV